MSTQLSPDSKAILRLHRSWAEGYLVFWYAAVVVLFLEIVHGSEIIAFRLLAVNCECVCNMNRRFDIGGRIGRDHAAEQSRN